MKAEEEIYEDGAMKADEGNEGFASPKYDASDEEQLDDAVTETQLDDAATETQHEDAANETKFEDAANGTELEDAADPDDCDLCLRNSYLRLWYNSLVEQKIIGGPPYDLYDDRYTTLNPWRMPDVWFRVRYLPLPPLRFPYPWEVLLIGPFLAGESRLSLTSLFGPLSHGQNLLLNSRTEEEPPFELILKWPDD